MTKQSNRRTTARRRNPPRPGAPSGQLRDTDGDPPTVNVNAILTPSHDQIAHRAYTIWINAGCPEGCDKANWERAQQEVNAEWNGT